MPKTKKTTLTKGDLSNELLYCRSTVRLLKAQLLVSNNELALKDRILTDFRLLVNHHVEELQKLRVEKSHLKTELEDTINECRKLADKLNSQ